MSRISSWVAVSRQVRVVSTSHAWLPCSLDWTMSPASPSIATARRACRPFAWRRMPSRQARVIASSLPVSKPSAATPVAQATPHRIRSSRLLVSAPRHAQPVVSQRGPHRRESPTCTSRWVKLPRTYVKSKVSPVRRWTSLPHARNSAHARTSTTASSVARSLRSRFPMVASSARTTARAPAPRWRLSPV